jgi:localization factor PodJL
MPPPAGLFNSTFAPRTAALPPSIGSRTLVTAAEGGDPAASFEVAVRYSEGRGVTIGLEEAAAWFERAARGGLTPAIFRLGGLYEKGIGVRKDLKRAQVLYSAAADRGSAKAMHNLAVLYAEGIEGKPDYPNALNWFRKAADRGVADSQFNLGVLYARGIGMEPNLAESYKWFSLAALGGDRDAAQKRDDVGKRLDPQTLKAVQASVQKWSPEPQPDEAVSVRAPAGGWDQAGPQAPAKGKADPKTNAKRTQGAPAKAL